MKTIFVFFLVLGFILTIPGLHTFSQVGINSDGTSPDGSAMLEVKSTSKGFLPPRIALTAANAASPITSPAIGLVVYNTANAGSGVNIVCPGIYHWNGQRWIRFIDGLTCGYAPLPANCSSNTPCNPSGTLTDIDGNIYATIIIGTQEWMAENLKVTHYCNGEAIPNVTDNAAWCSLTTGARCYYNNDSVTNNPVYGAMYNWFAVNDSRNLCPAGWHEPTDAEWTTLATYLGGPTVAGGKMKECGTSHWFSPNNGATNEVCFSYLPGGLRDTYLFTGDFNAIGYNGACWTVTESAPDFAWWRGPIFINGGFYRNSTFKSGGLNVRCVRD